MSEYPWNKKNNTFTWLSSLYNPFNGLETYVTQLEALLREVKKSLGFFLITSGLGKKVLNWTPWDYSYSKNSISTVVNIYMCHWLLRNTTPNPLQRQNNMWNLFKVNI